MALGTAPRDSDAKLRRSFAGLARATGPILTGLGTLQAPPRYRADLSVMRTSLARARRDLRAVALTAAAHQAAALKRALSRLTHDSAVVKAADHRLSVALGISS